MTERCFEVGKKYKTRGGQDAKVEFFICEPTETVCTVIGQVRGDDGWYAASWRTDGSFYGGSVSSGMDLMPETEYLWRAIGHNRMSAWKPTPRAAVTSPEIGSQLVMWFQRVERVDLNIDFSTSVFLNTSEVDIDAE